MALVEPRPDQFQDQVIYLDFDGAESITYHGPVVVEDIDVPAFETPTELAAQEDEIIEGIVAQLEDIFAGTGVMFTDQQPGESAQHSTIYIGGNDSAFSQYGSFLGLAEQVDIRNLDYADNALVFTENINISSQTFESCTYSIAAVAAHEIGHLLGLAHATHPTDSTIAGEADTLGGLLSQVAYATNVHKYIVEESISLFSEKYPDAWDDPSFDVLVNESFGWYAWDAAENEDIDPAPWGGDTHFGSVQPYFEHFFDPDELDTFDGLFLYSSALDRADVYWNGGDDEGGGDDFVGLVSLYESGSADLAWTYIGHVAHLVADMTVPAHAHSDAHVSPDQHWIGYVFGDDNYEEYTAVNYDQWDHADVPGAISTSSSIEQLFRTVAEETDNYDSDNEDGEDFWDGNLGEVEPELCNTYASVLIPNAIEYTASLFEMFVGEVKPTITGWVPAQASSSVVVSVTPDGKGSMGIRQVEFEVWNGSSWQHAATDASSAGGWNGTISLAGFSVGSNVYIRARALDQGGLYSDWAEWTVLKEFAGDPQSIVLSVDVSPDSNVGAYSPVTASGTVYYDNGDTVPTGIVLINNGTTVYTAAISNGVFSQVIEAPGSSRNVVFTAEEYVYGFPTVQATHFVSVEGSQQGSGYELTHLDIIYDKVLDGNGLVTQWWAKEAFGTDDEYVETLVYLEDVYDELQIRSEYYRPNGAHFGEARYYTVPDPGDYGYDYWYAYSVRLGWLIDGYETAYDPGLYTVEVSIDDGGGWDLVGTKYFSFAYNFTEHRMAEDIQDVSPYNFINPRTTFYTDSDDAYTWARLEWVAEDLDVKWEWYEPNGSRYSTSTYSIPDPVSQDYIQWDWYNVWSSIGIDGNSAASKPGDWHVNVFVEDPVHGGWDQIYTDYFQILERPAQAPLLTVSPNEAAPVEGASVSLTLLATDNTYLDAATLYWDDGEEHSLSWNSLYSGSLSRTANLGSLTGLLDIDYWATAVDTSGNSTTTSRMSLGFRPLAPETLASVTVGLDSVNLSWSDTSAIESGFRVERRADDADTWVEIGSVGPNVTSFEDQSLDANATYFYRVRAFNGTGESTWSNVVEVTTLHPIPGDANGDGLVNEDDATVLAGHWGMCGMTWADGDFNADGAVNAADASILAANWGAQIEVPFEIIVTPIDLTVPEGSTAEFAVELSAEPRFPVTVTVEWTSGDEDLTVNSGGTLTFDSDHPWNTPQTVTLAAAEDTDDLDSTAEFTISADGATNQPVLIARESDNDTEVCQIHGTKWNDLDGNGEQNGEEPGLAGWKIFVDTNLNGLWDTGEPYDVTDANGDYSISGLAPGAYVVAEVLQEDWEQTSPNTTDDPLVTILNPSAAADDVFASVLTAIGSNVLIGCRADDTDGSDVGIAYLFNGSTGELVRTFHSPSPAVDNKFGEAVGSIGNDALVAAVQPFVGPGVVYRFDVTTGAVKDTIPNPNPHSQDRFGAAIAGLGNYIVIGAPYSDAFASDGGAVYVFDEASGDQSTILNHTPNADDYFGSALAIMGNMLAVGAPKDESGGVRAGAVYVFNLSTGEKLFTIENPSRDNDDLFGGVLAAVDGNWVVGASRDSTDATCSGSTYLFEGATGSLRHTFKNPHPGSQHRFGGALASMGSIVLIGAPGDASSGVAGGAAYAFDSHTGQLLQTYYSPTPDANDIFGVSMVSVANKLVVGASQDATLANNAGTAYSFWGPAENSAAGAHLLPLATGENAENVDFGNRQVGEAADNIIYPSQGPLVGPVLARPAKVARRLIAPVRREEAVETASVIASVVEPTPYAAAADAALAEEYGPQFEQPSVECQRLAWSYTLARRQPHEREHSILAKTALAIDLLLADRPM